jgi:general stress protein 26
MEWAEVAENIDGVASLATSTADGRPHSAAVSAAVDGERLFFAIGTTSAMARRITENPRVALMWRPAAEVYVRGTATVVDDHAERRRIWDSGLLPYDPAGFWTSVDNPEWLLVEVTPMSAIVFVERDGAIARLRWHRDR